MTKQKRRSKRKNTTSLGDFSLKSLHKRRMREITAHTDPLFPLSIHPLIQIMNIDSHPSY